jgi:hypothetical protein
MFTSLVFPCLFYLFLNAAEIKANLQEQRQEAIQYEPKMNGFKFGYPVTKSGGDEKEERATLGE